MCPNENESVSSINKIAAKSKEINWKLLGITLGIVFSAYGAFFGTHSFFMNMNIEAKEENLKTESRIQKRILELSRIESKLKIDSLVGLLNVRKEELLKLSRSFAEREKKYIERIKKSKKLLTTKEINDLLVTANKSRAASEKQDSILSKLDLNVIQNNMWNKWDDLKVQQRPPIP